MTQVPTPVQAPAYLPGRSCADCTMCCKVMEIAELSKPQHKVCVHCEAGKGCKIYEARPRECADFICLYLFDARFGEEWKPSKIRMVLTYQRRANRLIIHVDKDRPDAWKRAPYYAQIRQMAVAADRNRGQVIVWQGEEAVAVLQGREKLLGRVRDDQVIVPQQQMGPQGLVTTDVLVLDRNDPRLQNRKLAADDFGAALRAFGSGG